MAAVSTYVADYTDPADAKIVSDLLNGYALDQFGNSGPLPDDIRARLCSELAKIQGAFSVGPGTWPRHDTYAAAPPSPQFIGYHATLPWPPPPPPPPLPLLLPPTPHWLSKASTRTLNPRFMSDVAMASNGLSPATSSTRVMSPRLLSLCAAYNVASNPSSSPATAVNAPASVRTLKMVQKHLSQAPT